MFSKRLYGKSQLKHVKWFVALVPLLFAIDAAPSPRAALGAAALAGFVANQGRVYFLLETLINSV